MSAALCVVDSVHVWHYCEWLETQPKRASHFIPLGILQDKEMRRDVLFHTPGTEWGWRPRRRWRDLLIERGQVPPELLTRPGDEELAEVVARMVAGETDTVLLVDGVPVEPGRFLCVDLEDCLKHPLTFFDSSILLGLSEATVYKRLHSGELPGFKYGNRWYTYADDLLEHAKQHNLDLDRDEVIRYLYEGFEEGHWQSISPWSLFDPAKGRASGWVRERWPEGSGLEVAMRRAASDRQRGGQSE